MSQWFFKQFIQSQAAIRQKKTYRVIDILIAVLIICLGIFLIFYSLDNDRYIQRGQNPAVINGTNFSPSVVYWRDQIEAWAESFNLDPVLVATVMQIESCGDPQALSSANAHGLFQVMPYHFNQTEDMLDPQTNALRGLAYLSESFEKADGDIESTLAGYNGGHGQITRNEKLWPEETQRYVYWGSRLYQEAVSGKNQGKTLHAWLSAGGWHLCQQAEQNLGLE